jgi:hypothetical protein
MPARSSGWPGSPATGSASWPTCLAGVLTPAAGRVKIDGATVNPLSPLNVQRLGIGRIPEDRMGTGLITTLPLSANIVLPRIRERRFSRFGFLKPGAIRRNSPATGSTSSASRPPAARFAPAIFPAATCKRPCWPGSWPGNPRCCWRPSPPGGWMSPRPGSFTGSFSNCGQGKRRAGHQRGSR